MKKIIYLLVLMIMAIACNKERKNPFFSEWGGEFGLPPFSQITEQDYIPAIEEGIKQHSAEIQAIINDKKTPNFANTIEVFDHSGKLLSKVVGVLFNLSETNSSDSLNKIVEVVMPMLSEHNDNIYMNPDFFKRVKTVFDNQQNENLTIEQKQVISKIYKRFIRNGIDLPADKQARLRDINKQISLLENKFSTNLLAETNEFQLFIDKKEDLAGLPENTIETAAADAQAANKEGQWLFTLKNPSYVPFMKYSAKRDLREKMFRAYSMRGNNGNDNDNKKVILELMKFRIEKAKLLGYNTSADYYLDETLAKTPAAAYDLMNKIMPAALNKAKMEVQEMQNIIDKERGGFKLQSWDWAYYAEKLRKQKYAMDEAEISQYFQMENVREGVFKTASKLYGIKFEPIKNANVYYKEVEAFKISDENDSLVGILYTDYYPRNSKRGGAWMNNFRDQQVIDGKDVRPIIVNVGNFTKPTPNKPSLLTLDEVETMWHEFGHALHGLLSKCHYSTVSGTATPRDFVEMPSQINENWAFEQEVLATYAKHFKTGEIIPDSLVEKIKKSGTFNQGFMTTELVAAAILDMDWHTLSSLDNVEVIDFENKSIKKMGLIDEIIPRYRSTYFNHIFNTGYSAGYYSYLWSEMLDKDAFEVFRKNGIFDAATSKSFKDNILSKGSSDDLMLLFEKFRGQAPSIEPMLIGRGLK